VLFSPYSGAAVTSALYVNPFILFPVGSYESELVTTYEKFRFREFKIFYQPTSTTGTTGSFYMGYYPDPAINSTDVTTAVMAAQPGTVSGPVWATGVGTNIKNLMDKVTWFYSDFANTVTDSAQRLCMQGVVTGLWKLLPVSAGTYGDIFIEYVLDLINPKTPTDYAGLLGIPRIELFNLRQKLRIRAKEAEKKALLESYRKVLEEDKDSDRKSPVEGGDDPVYVSVPDVSGMTKVYQQQPIAVDALDLPAFPGRGLGLTPPPPRSSSKK
jgi:hypothetical protein